LSSILETASIFEILLLVETLQDFTINLHFTINSPPKTLKN